MLSKIITVLFAVNCISTVNGFIDSKLRVLEPILKCYEANTPEFAGEKKMAERINLDSEADMIKLSCLAIREYDTCLADVIKKTSSPVPKVFLFYVAEAYQTSYLLKKANFCPWINYYHLKKIVLYSGIMIKEGLSNIEHDRYHKCAGDAMKKCVIESMQMYEYELKEADPEAGDDADDDYIRCIEEQSKTCHYPIMHHLFKQIEAYKKHVKQLEMPEAEERQG